MTIEPFVVLIFAMRFRLLKLLFQVCISPKEYFAKGVVMQALETLEAPKLAPRLKEYLRWLVN